jgi:hypothetical protein
MQMPAITVSVSVPEERVQELLSFAAELWTPQVVQPGPTHTPVVEASATSGSRVRRAFEGGVSDYWRPFLVFVARRPEQWVVMSEGFDAVGLSVQQGVGMIGAAERRCQGDGYMPYEKRWGRDGRAEVRMNADVAQEILRLADVWTPSA